MRLIDADDILAKETQAYNNVKLELSGKNDQMSVMTRAVNECVHRLVHSAFRREDEEHDEL